MEFFQIIGIIISAYFAIGAFTGCVEFYLSSPKDVPLGIVILICTFFWPWILSDRFKR